MLADPHMTPSRRVFVAAAAWAVPAVVFSAPVPAFATASGQPVVTISTPGDDVPPSGEVWLTVTVRSASGAPVVGASVSVSGPTGARFGSASGTTDGGGQFSTLFDLAQPSATPGTTVVVSALVDGQGSTAALTVVGPFGSCAAG